MGDLKGDDHVEDSIIRLKKSWKLYKQKAKKSKYGLLLSVAHAFRCISISSINYIGECTFIVFINFLCTGLNLLSPFFINRIIEFIETKDRP